MNNNQKRIIYKVLGILLVLYALIRGITMDIPQIGNLGETWRNLFYHVPMWYGMIIILFTSVGYSIQYLNKESHIYDIKAEAASRVGVLMGILGLITGSIWSRVTWGEALPASDLSAWWAWDPKQTSALILVLIYFSYFLLRSSFRDPEQKARISAVFNIFAAAMIIPMFYIVPKVLGGLHPGSGDEGALASLKSLDSMTRAVFYPSSIGFTLIGFWLMEITVRTEKIKHKYLELVS